MSFQPVLPLGGYAGWRFLEKTLVRQQAGHAAAAGPQRAEKHFREQIAGVNSARDLIADRQLLVISLTAFGLRDDLPNRAFIERVLESSTTDRTSFVNRLADRRYLALAEAFGFGDDAPPRNKEPGFADRMIDLYRDRRFEEAVGEQDESMRLALALRRDLTQMAQRETGEQALWLTVLGTPSLRKVFESAYRLPSGFGALDLDRQVDIMRERTRRMFNDPGIAQFSDPTRVNDLIQRFLLSQQLDQIDTARSNSTALTLLQAGQSSLRQLLQR
ncbi:MAG: DUF1217 domain-containing protein [Pararhodobacter sp.]|nr:DUF1217 domain-containing protein [Pararhodobacter sp.]